MNRIQHEGRSQVAFLLSCVDGIIHLYTQVRTISHEPKRESNPTVLKSTQSEEFIELTSSFFFPMLGKVSDHKIK